MNGMIARRVALLVMLGGLASRPARAEAPLSLPRLARILGLDDSPRPESPPRCAVKLRLLGTLVSRQAEWSLATLQDENRHRTHSLRVGDTVAAHLIVSIERRRIVLDDGAAREVIELQPDGSAPPPAPPVASSGPVATLSSGEYVVDVTRLMSARAEQLMTGARAIPVFGNGAIEGFRVFVRPGSDYEQLGIRNKDVIRRVNGVAIDSPERALELYQQLRSATSAEVELARDGAVIRQRYQLRW